MSETNGEKQFGHAILSNLGLVVTLMMLLLGGAAGYAAKSATVEGEQAVQDQKIGQLRASVDILQSDMSEIRKQHVLMMLDLSEIRTAMGIPRRKP